MNHAICLPRVSEAIPLSIVPGKLAAANATIARFLLQAGAIREGDIPPIWDDAIAVCERALDAWVKRELGSLHCVQPCFRLTASDGVDGSCVYPPSPPKGPLCYRKVEVCWFESSEQQWAVGTGLEALERTHIGLGQAVLAVLSDRSRFAYPVFTPDLACDAASYLYWHGEENEETALDEECDNDEDRTAMRDEMVTRAKLDHAYPTWVIARPRTPLSIAALTRIADELSEPFARDIVADTLALARLRITDDYRPDIEGEFIGFGAVLSWREDDLTVRIYDDLLQMAHQSEFCDLMGELEIDLDAPGAMRKWQRAMRVRFNAILLIDRLIHRLLERH